MVQSEKKKKEEKKNYELHLRMALAWLDLEK